FVRTQIFSALFFFQAEDGIRARNVTGVQTCALPICGIPPVPPRKLALTFPWLPPILYKLHKQSISSYSKAPRGLSVLSRVMRIFTHSIISPGLSLRQCPSRCTFRAGRNLPDKE